MIPIRKELQRFVQHMEMRLQKNDHKGGWTYSPASFLLRRLREEVEELREAIKQASAHPREMGVYSKVWAEAADVANFAMMLSDTVGGGSETAVSAAEEIVCSDCGTHYSCEYRVAYRCPCCHKPHLELGEGDNEQG